MCKNKFPGCRIQRCGKSINGEEGMQGSAEVFFSFLLDFWLSVKTLKMSLGNICLLVEVMITGGDILMHSKYLTILFVWSMVSSHPYRSSGSGSQSFAHLFSLFP